MANFMLYMVYHNKKMRSSKQRRKKISMQQNNLNQKLKY